MPQNDLFAAPPAVDTRRDADTRRAAADRIAPKAERLQRVVYAAFAAAGSDGLTADEAAERLQLSPFTVRPRVTELRHAGRIVDSGRRRANRSGATAIVWTAAIPSETTPAPTTEEPT